MQTQVTPSRDRGTGFRTKDAESAHMHANTQLFVMTTIISRGP